MPTKDINLEVMSGGGLASSQFMTEVRLKGAPIEGYALEVMIPDTATGATDETLDIYIFAATATGVDSDDALVGQTPVQLTTSTAVGQHIIPFHLPPNYEYVKPKADVGGTSPDFSNAYAYIVQNPGSSFTRATHWD
ncbi:MAG: hypothetical protein MJA29_05490 [Candidatus Omnitrophica bacterium]|nr:hypothetical protein [Candidatus Omnitrophota bacterium]